MDPCSPMRIVRSTQGWILMCNAGPVCLRRALRRCRYRVGELCEVLGCSESYLRRVFVRDLGLAPSALSAEWRMVEARHRLRAGEDEDRLARRLGFSSVAGLRRAFRECYGVTPRSYRSAGRERWWAGRVADARRSA